MTAAAREQYERTLAEIRSAGTYKKERVIEGPQGPKIDVGGATPLNFCANNYLGLSSHPALINAAHEALDRWGFGLSSVRFICGTQAPHKELERRIAGFLGLEDAILYTSCFDANAGLFETLLDEGCAIISDALNHASIIDGVRLCKAERHRYAHSDMEELERCLMASAGARIRMIATDGVFSMDGDLAKLDEICELADKHHALVMVDDSHSTGFVGKTGRGTAEAKGVQGRVDIVTTTFGKALGGASGGCTAGSKTAVELLRQRSRPYLFSNTLAPPIVGASLAALDLLEGSTELRDRVMANARRFREKIARAGFAIKPGDHPIVPIMLGDAALATGMADALLGRGIYVIGFSYPVVAKGQARIRVQLSAAHTSEMIDRAVDAFAAVGRELGVLR